MTIRFAFYGRVSTEDKQDPAASKAWQLRRALALIEACGGQIVTEYFDVDKSRSIPWVRRPQASALLNALKNPNRGFDAVVIGEPHRAFYGGQYGLTFPIFDHYGVPLWVPEVGGRIDPENEAHDMIMSVFGGLSKGERNRIRTRVRSSMAAIAVTEGRYLGGRPPYGYKLVDAGPHPHPGKAADGKRLYKLAIDPDAKPVVKRIFREFLGLKGSIEKGLFAIAEGLTRDGIPCPSAHDRARNRHREGLAWSKGAVRAILTNPRYTGYQVWNRQHRDEVLIDVDDVSLGHITKLKWNDRDQWVYSKKVVHPVIIPKRTFSRIEGKLAARRRQKGGTKARERTKRQYALRGVIYCGLCHRKMQAHAYSDYTYFRCRYPQEYALANKVQHPRNVFVREKQVTELLDPWLAKVLAPHRIKQTIADLYGAQKQPANTVAIRARAKIADCDNKLNRHRAALEAGADPVTITKWIAETNSERTAAEAELREAESGQQQTMTEEEIEQFIIRLGGLVCILTNAKPQDQQNVYQQLGVRLTYQPDKQEIRVEANLDPDHIGLSTDDPYHGVTVRVRGGT
ncbi:recombinase family protein [Actinomadura barringtoniae]|uniref:Recombinase family protein n=1 Tax=Actinomadura barringtoniae TaxID=1427535 RepID=A0A939PKN1_9ACTN|nr:recombinase family protein [Actinomadura barringtoniae]MBO2451619.1 recombinase family protein [Actinomadura barringtoniae]